MARAIRDTIIVVVEPLGFAVRLVGSSASARDAVVKGLLAVGDAAPSHVSACRSERSMFRAEGNAKAVC